MRKWKPELETPSGRMKTSWLSEKMQTEMVRALAKTILPGTVQGGDEEADRGNDGKTHIKEWTGLEWNIILRKAENRVEWKKLL